MSAENKVPSVIRFEQAVNLGDHELACSELLEILSKVDSNFGGIHDIECDFPVQLENLYQERTVHFCTRVANGITRLFIDPNLEISDSGTRRFLGFQRWIGLIFASSPYVNADHILQTYNRNEQRENPSEIYLEDSRAYLNKFCILYLPESNVTLNLDALWELDPELCVSLCFALQSPRALPTEQAYTKRSAILQWLPERLAQMADLTQLPATIAHDVYMHCSYDISENKHLVKKALNEVIRRHLLSVGWEDRQIQHIGKTQGKPVMVVLLEHFHALHSVFRTHSTSLIAAREHFYLIGLGGEGLIDEAGKAVFDEFQLLDGDSILGKLEQIKAICEAHQAAIFYMPSVGMDLTSIFASNVRVAPVQAMALGHPATTHSAFIDYAVVEDDYVGSEACFSETLLRLPKDALPYVPSAFAPSEVEYLFRENPEVVNIGVAATTMKLNPYFLQACRAIYERAKVNVHFHFALGQSSGVTHPYMTRFIKSYLGNAATVYPHMPYDQYLSTLYQCDMMINPFPFGNTNGIIDMVTLGLVGVCKTGAEVHEHIDEGLFKRLGLPEWLIADNVDEYVERAIRLAENHQERLAIRRQLIENNGLQTLFSGNPKPMSEMLLKTVADWAAKNKVAFDVVVAEKAKPAKKASKSTVKKADTAPKKKVTEKAEKAKTEPKKAPAKKPAAKKTSPLKAEAKKLKKASE